MERSWEPGRGIHASSAMRVHPFWAGVCGLTLRRARWRRLVLLRIASGFRGENGLGTGEVESKPRGLKYDRGYRVAAGNPAGSGGLWRGGFNWSAFGGVELRDGTLRGGALRGVYRIGQRGGFAAELGRGI